MTRLSEIGCIILASVCTLAAQNPPQAEVATKDEPATFKTRVNLVMVPVVVRDKQGKAIGNLKQEDFQLFDRGKPQTISKFSMEKAARPAIVKDTSAPDSDKSEPAPVDLPDRFIGYVFDDIHVNFGDLVRVRDAASRHMTNELKATDRAAIFTTSGQLQIDFTDNHKELLDTLARLRPHPIARAAVQECPDVSYYMGDLIFNKHDSNALQAGVAEALACLGLDPTNPNDVQTATQMTQAAAQRAFSSGQQETHVALATLKDLVRRMSAMPGQRTIILASPGFLRMAENMQEEMDVLERAIKSNVIINTLDARGLYTDDIDITKNSYNSFSLRMKAQYDREAMRADSDVLAELSAGTGGSFVENTNDLDNGYKRLGAAPEYYYLLGFSPQNLKMDGSFHSLKVTVKQTAGLTLSARKGYYAPTHAASAEQTAKAEIEEALFSREEMHDLPIELHTQFFKTSEDIARVTVITGVDLKRLKLRKDNGRNVNTLTIVTGLFDRNGNFVSGITKKLEMRLLDARLERWLSTGITVKSSLEVRPGTYAVRLVVRDDEGQMMTAANGAVDIPN